MCDRDSYPPYEPVAGTGTPAIKPASAAGQGTTTPALAAATCNFVPVDHGPECGRPAVAAYVVAGKRYTKCRIHDTVLVRHTALADGVERLDLTEPVVLSDGQLWGAA